MFYKVPIVRHRFEDPQHEHEVDWADMFFDLTYVGAAYQVSVYPLFYEDEPSLSLCSTLLLLLCLYTARGINLFHYYISRNNYIANHSSCVFFTSSEPCSSTMLVLAVFSTFAVSHCV